MTLEIIMGRVDADGDTKDFWVPPLHASAQQEQGAYLFESMIEPGSRSGFYGYAIRVWPKHPDLVTPFLPGLILWASGDASLAAGSREKRHSASAK